MTRSIDLARFPNFLHGMSRELSACGGESRLETVLPSGLLNLDLSGGSKRQWKQQLSLSVGSLPIALRDLRLSNLGLQRLPIALKECKELRTLDLSYNNFAMHWTGRILAAEGGAPDGAGMER